MPESEVYAYTDGASTGSRGPGGYGAVIYWERKIEEIRGGEQDTTNLRMEITAACVALEGIDEGHVPLVYSDCSYLVNCMRRGWYKKWRENGWLNYRNEPVANRNLWERLLEAAQRHKEVRWRKVRGHSKTGVPHKSRNDRADALAVAALNRAQDLCSRTDLNCLYQEALLFEKRYFAGALSAPGLSVISEIKRASPSTGFIRDADPAEWGARYELEGAGCLSVLTEPERFQGSLEDLDAARNSTTVPVLRKDFTIDEAQILEQAPGPTPSCSLRRSSKRRRSPATSPWPWRLA